MSVLYVEDACRWFACVHMHACVFDSLKWCLLVLYVCGVCRHLPRLSHCHVSFSIICRIGTLPNTGVPTKCDDCFEQLRVTP